MKDEVVIVKKHALWIRWAHWINFPILTLMIFSGIQIYWANDIYTPFISRKIYPLLGLSHKLSDGMFLHFALAWIFVVNGILYTCYLLFSGEWRELVPKIASFKEAFLVMLHDLGLRKEAPVQGKFNAAQRIAYTSIILVGMIATASGFAVYKPVQLHWLTSLFLGYEGARLVHFLAMIAFIGFFGIHIAQVIRSGWNNFQSMITGYEVENESENKKV